MTVNDARKNANRKWDSENMMTLACRVPRAMGLNFKAMAERNNTTAHQLLKGFVLNYLRGDAPYHTKGDAPFMEAALDAVRGIAKEAGVNPAGLLHSIVWEWVANYEETHKSVQ